MLPVEERAPNRKLCIPNYVILIFTIRLFLTEENIVFRIHIVHCFSRTSLLLNVRIDGCTIKMSIIVYSIFNENNLREFFLFRSLVTGAIVTGTLTWKSKCIHSRSFFACAADSDKRVKPMLRSDSSTHLHSSSVEVVLATHELLVRFH